MKKNRPSSGFGSAWHKKPFTLDDLVMASKPEKKPLFETENAQKAFETWEEQNREILKKEYRQKNNMILSYPYFCRAVYTGRIKLTSSK